MKIASCEVTNFGSYKNLSFNPSDRGLTLVHGPTGVGKSTLMDAVMWTLFGVTAKDGVADDVRPWNNNEVTKGEVTIHDKIKVTRTRGRGNGELHFVRLREGIESPTGVQRGKDLPETQRLIEDILGVNAALYQTAAYYHELSPTASFFTANAKSRRELFEKIVDLSLPTTLNERSTRRNSDIKKSIALMEIAISRRTGKIEQLRSTIKDSIHRSERHYSETEKKKKDDRKKWQDFEIKRKKEIETLQDQISKLRGSITESPNCPTCGQFIESNTNVTRRINTLDMSLNDIRRRINPYNEPIDKVNTNPYDELIRVSGRQLEALERELRVDLEAKEVAEYESAAISNIQDLVVSLRAKLMERAVSEIETNTNHYLDKYYDSVFRVVFEALGDNIGVHIYKDGTECSYKQLSKGQRQILKLCFAVSIMSSASNQAGVHFDEIYVDEAMSGMDEKFKIKSYSLFEELSLTHGSVFVIEHSSEFAQQFNNSIEISQVNGHSVIK